MVYKEKSIGFVLLAGVGVVVIGSLIKHCLNKFRTKNIQKKLKAMGVEILPIHPLYARSGMHYFKHEGYIFPDFMEETYCDVQNFIARPDDNFVVTFYKSGTTWMQQIVWLIVHDPDCIQPKQENIDDVFPYLEFCQHYHQIAIHLPSPRLLKSHLPYKLLPKSLLDKKCKIIFVARNPKDVITSAFHFSRDMLIFQYRGTIEQMCEELLTDTGMFCPYWDQILDYWNHRNDENILFIKFEDMKKDLHSVVQQVAEFLGKTLNDAQISKITKQSTFQSMKKNPAVNREYWKALKFAPKNFTFMRKGEVGDWKNYLTVTLSNQIDEWYQKNVAGTGLVFDFEL